MILLDTTVLAYAVGGAHPLSGPCRTIVDEIGGGRLVATTTIEVIQEFVHVHSRRGRRAAAIGLGRDFVRVLSPLQVTETEDLEAGLGLLESHEALGAFDAVFAAVAIRRGAALVSADAAFGKLPGLRHVDPARPDDVLALLAPRA